MIDDPAVAIFATLCLAVGAGLLFYWIGNAVDVWLTGRRKPAVSSSTEVVKVPMAVVKAPPPASRELRQTTAQLAQAGKANRALAARLEQVLAENHRLRSALEERPVMDPWHPTDTVEITEADYLPEVAYRRPVRSIDWDYLASMLGDVPSHA